MHNSIMNPEKAIRVLIANRPRLMRDLILATINDHSEIKVVGEVEDERDIRRNVEQTRPDYLIIASTNPINVLHFAMHCCEIFRR